MSDSGVNAGYLRDYFLWKRICVCDPTLGDSCRFCDGTEMDERELRHSKPRQAKTRDGNGPDRT